MNQSAKYYLLIVLFLNITQIFASETTEVFEGMWAGLEVMGTDKKTAQLIRDIVPIKKGDLFSSAHSKKREKWCNSIKAEVKSAEVNCGFIGYPGGEFYYDVQIIDRKEKDTFRTIPYSLKNNIKIERELLSLFNDFDKLYWTLLPKGIFPVENFEKGYVDYDVPALHAFAEPLAKLAQIHNQNLLDVINYSSDPELRSKAATLISWSQTPKNIEYILDNDLLNDPNEWVRNDLARSFSFFLTEIDDAVLLQKSVNAFCKQAKLHSHGDRNKALHSIQTILSKKPDIADAIDGKCIKTIEYIAEMSILPNVGGFAEDILKRIDKFENEKNTHSNG